MSAPAIPPKPKLAANANAASLLSGSGGAESAPQLELRGHDLMEEGEKAAKSWFNKKKEAITAFENAAGQFRKAEQYALAAGAYTRAGEVCELNKQPFEAANFYGQAAKMYRHTGQVKQAIEQYELAVHITIGDSRLGAAAHLYKGMAEIHESTKQWKLAISLYEKSGDCYQAQDTLSQANQVYVKAATLSAERHEWSKAAEMFERAAKNVEPSKLVQAIVSEYYFKAALAILVPAVREANLTPARLAIARYAAANVTFKNSKENSFLSDLVGAIDLMDEKAYTNVVYQYDKRVGRVDDLSALMLLDIKRAIKGEYEPKINFEENTAASAAAGIIGLGNDGAVEYDMQSDLSGKPATAAIGSTPKLAAKAAAFVASYANAQSATAASGAGPSPSAAAAALTPLSSASVVAAPKSNDRKAPPPPIPAKPTLTPKLSGSIAHARTPSGTVVLVSPTGSSTGGTTPIGLATIPHVATSPTGLDMRDSKHSQSAAATAPAAAMTGDQRAELEAMYKRASPQFQTLPAATASASTSAGTVPHKPVSAATAAAIAAVAAAATSAAPSDGGIPEFSTSGGDDEPSMQ